MAQEKQISSKSIISKQDWDAYCKDMTEKKKRKQALRGKGFGKMSDAKRQILTVLRNEGSMLSKEILAQLGETWKGRLHPSYASLETSGYVTSELIRTKTGFIRKKYSITDLGAQALDAVENN